LLSGDLGVAGDPSDNSRLVLSTYIADATTLLDGFTITAANGTAGMSNLGSSMTISHCLFTGNFSSAMFNDRSIELNVTQCVFTNNRAATGAAIYNTAGTAIISSCAFTDNAAANGGAVYNIKSAAAQFSDCTFASNAASIAGGAVFIDGNTRAGATGTPTFLRCAFSSNSAPTGGAVTVAQAFKPALNVAAFADSTFENNRAGAGGAMELHTQVLTNGCTFTRNVATNTSGSAGGAVWMEGSETSTFVGSAFNGNHSSYQGGAAYAYTGGFVPINCSFVGNSAVGEGGAVYTFGSAAPTVNCTFVSNTSAVEGGAIRTNGQISNCIFRDNFAPAHPQIELGVYLPKYSDVQGGMSGAGNIDVDPVFLSNPSSGPDGLWGTADDNYGDLRIAPYSPVADAGDNSAVAPFTSVDADGNNRFVDIPTTPDTGAGTPPIVDMGAYEAQPVLSAGAGGACSVIAGNLVTLHGQGASDVAGPLSFEWDLDHDGQFDDSTLANPVVNSTGLAVGNYAIAVRVTDAASRSVIATTTLSVVPHFMFVDSRAHGAGNGTSWNDAIPSLTVALDRAISGVVIEVAQGIYKPTNATGRGASFLLKPGVSVVGGYAGLGAPEPDINSPARYLSVLSGDLGVIGNPDDNTYHVVTARSGGTLSGCVIANGDADGEGDLGAGGGYYGAGTIALSNCLFFGNSAIAGGGLYARYGATLSNCVFVGNVALTDGGGAFAGGTFEGCTFTANAAARGGAIYAPAAGMMRNTILWGNTAPNGSQVFTSSSQWSRSYSDIQGGMPGAGGFNIDADPQFIRNPSPGGDGRWGTADDDYGDVRLRITSQCIDVGPYNPGTDITGGARSVNIPVINDEDVFEDIGAFERPLASAEDEFLFAAPHPSIRIRFAVPVNPASLQVSDLHLVNLTTGQIIDVPAVATLSYDPATLLATWSFGSPLPDGNYRGTIPADSVTPIDQPPMLQDFVFDFFSLAGDANHDRHVDISDLSILAGHWMQSGATFAQGDFNYDGKVNATDLGILSQHWQQMLANPFAQPPAAVPARAPSRTPQRVASLVLR
jgi:hypothetical protein